MLWSVASVIVAGLALGCTFRAPMMLVGSAAIVGAGVATSTVWPTWLALLALFQGAYLAALMVSSARSRKAGANRGQDGG